MGSNFGGLETFRAELEPLLNGMRDSGNTLFLPHLNREVSLLDLYGLSMREPKMIHRPRKSASLAVYYFDHDPFYRRLVQNAQIHLEHARKGYDKVVLLKSNYADLPFKTDPDVIDLPTWALSDGRISKIRGQSRVRNAIREFLPEYIQRVCQEME